MVTMLIFNAVAAAATAVTDDDNNNGNDYDNNKKTYSNQLNDWFLSCSYLVKVTACLL